MLPLSPIRAVTVRLREIPGGVLVGEVVRRMFGHQERTVEIEDFDGDLRMFLDLSEHMQSQIFWHGSYSRNILFLLRRILKPGMTVVDGGANVGEISLVAAKRVGSNGRVIAFEPVPTLADRLEKNAAANRLGNLEVVRMGLSDRPGTAPIYLADDIYRDGTENRGLGTLFPSSSRSQASSIVPLTTLDAFARDHLERVDIIKLDIEGGELAALNGAIKILDTQSPALIVELAELNCKAAGYEMADIANLLSRYDYQMFRIERRGGLRRIGVDNLVPFQNVYCVRVPSSSKAA